ncbi:glutamate receptor ionotropic, NMDA 2B-like [Hydractinia symbiolongicarpus]|uniref:glutamate receptor ionotropic, NMDA 2B-like n=1 Tax=Hydractinia symbiolongicarpus TaxID=13093 RepID=UPI00254EB089|nr:glutamate receptor ionotropic, NMDA 2B-like [Hydractinia symbiolongicarpus]
MIFHLTVVILSILARYQLLVLSINLCKNSNNSLHEVIQLFQEVQISSGSFSLTLKKYSDHESKILDVYANYIGEELFNTTTNFQNNFCILPILEEYYNFKTLLILDRGRNQHIQEYFQYETFLYSNGINRKRLAKDVSTWKAHGFKMFVLLCSLQCNLDIMRMALTIEILDEGFVWLTNKKELGFFEEDHTAHIFYVDLKLNNSSLALDCAFVSDINKLRIKGDKIMLYHAENMRQLSELFLLNQMLWSPLIREEKLSTTIDLSIANTQSKGRKMIRTVTIIEPPFIMFARHPPSKYTNNCELGRICWESQYQNESRLPVPRCCIGLCIDLLVFMESELEISTHLYIVEDGAYGTEVNGTYNGLVGDLITGKAELILAPLTMYATRAKRIMFSEPFRSNGVAIATVAQKIEYSFFSLKVFSPLTIQLWTATFLVAFLASIILSCMEYCIHQKEQPFYPWSESILYQIGLVFQRDMGAQNPTQISTRIIAISVAIFMMILMSSYTAILTANKVINPHFFPIKGLKDEKITNPTLDFKFGTLDNSGITQMFRDSDKKEWRAMYDYMKKFNFIDTDQAMNDLRSGKLDAIIHDATILKYYGSKDVQCNIHMVGEIIPDGGYAFATAKESELLNGITRSIRKYKSSGELENLDKRWFRNNCKAGKNHDHIEQADIYSFGGLFVVMVAGTVFSFALFLMEHMWVKARRASYKLQSFKI